MRPLAGLGMFIVWELAGAPEGLRAQDAKLESGRIVGQVVDAQTGQPVENVAVRLLDLDRPAQLTDSNGRFTLPDVPPGVRQLELEHIAYGKVLHAVNVPRGDVVVIAARLRQAAIALDSLSVTVERRRSFLEQVGFVRRQQSGWGRFFIDEAVDWTHLDQSLLSVGAVRIKHDGTRSHVYMKRNGLDCTPDIYLDGARQLGADGDFRDVVAGLDIAAMEVYRGQNTPIEFQVVGGVPCGAIVVWRKKY